MNFQYLPPVERSKHYLDIAFKKAREKSSKKILGDWIVKIRTKEAIKLDVIKDQLIIKLDKIVKDFPSIDNLPNFYQELIKLTLDYGQLKRSLGGISWGIGKIRYLHGDYVRRISKSSDAPKIKKLSTEFYGRISSIVKQLDKNLVFLEASRRVMKSFPDVKEMPTVCIFGFPNVGKTTLLNKLTGSNGEVASYAFTTTGINSGFLTINKEKIQFLDVPGTLDRGDKMNDIEKIAYLVVTELAEVLIYVFDLSGIGYGMKQQEALFKNLKKIAGKKKILVYLSKQDIVEKEQIKEFSKKYPISTNLKKDLADIL